VIEPASPLPVDRALNTVASVLYDATVVAGGPSCVDALAADGYAVHFIAETYKHAKPLALIGEADQLAETARLPIANGSDRPTAPASKPMTGAMDGVVILKPGERPGDGFIAELSAAIAAHRHYNRPVDGIPA